MSISQSSFNKRSCDAAKPEETAKEKAAREAREKKEKAQEEIRKREAEEAAQNLGIL